MTNKEQKVFSRSICIRRLEMDELKKILEDDYGINYFISNKENHSNRTLSNQLENVYNIALETLQKNGYALPYWQFMIKGEDPSYIGRAYMHDMVILAYMYKKVRNDNVKPEDMPISNSTRGIYMQKMEETAISQILGISRTSLSSKIWHTKETKEGKVLTVQPESKKITMNAILYQFYAGLISTTTKNPFIDIKYGKELLKYETVTEETLKEHAEELGENVNILFKNTYFLKPKYQKALLYLFNNVTGSAELFQKMQIFHHSVITIEDVKKFYKIFWNKMETLYKKDEGRINHLEEDDNVIKLCHKYLFEGLLASYYYSMASKVDNVYSNGLYPISESLCCISRNAHGNLYINSIGKDYYYKTCINKKRDLYNWTRHVCTHTKYTTKRFLPALYYLFIYYLELGKLLNKEGKCELIDYLSRNMNEIEKNFFDYKNGFKDTNRETMESYYKERREKFLGYAKGVTKPLF